MKIAVVGGHLAPSLGFINSLPKGTEVIYLGRKHPFEKDEGLSLEYKAIINLGIKFIEIPTGRLQRKISSSTLSSLAKLPSGFLSAFEILKKERPDILIGFGGYLSLPLGFSAKILGIPLVIHESTLGAGLANRILANFANKICISSDTSRKYFPDKRTVFTGNPMLPFDKKNIDELMPLTKEKLPFVVVIGGSAGSHMVNQIILENIDKLLDFTKITHITGDSLEYNDFSKLEKIKNDLVKDKKDRYFLTKYVSPNKINSLLDKSDLIISRAGFNSITTFLVLKKKSIVIPLPTGQKNEQMENAKMLESSGLGLILEQEVASRKIVESVKRFLNQKLKKITFSIPIDTNGGKNLVEEVFKCLKYQKGN